MQGGFVPLILMASGRARIGGLGNPDLISTSVRLARPLAYPSSSLRYV